MGSDRARARERAWGVAAMAGWRAAAYYLLGVVFLHPQGQRLWRCRATVGEFRHYDDALAQFAFFASWRRLLDILESVGERDLVALQAEHVRLFCANPSGQPCLPYESCYVALDGQNPGLVLAQLERTYGRAGLRPDPATHERPDHAAVELEFMAYLCRQEAGAWERAASDEACEALAQQRAFLALHLGRWLGTFARQVRAAADERLYVAAAEAADAFVHHDREVIGCLLEGIGRLST